MEVDPNAVLESLGAARKFADPTAPKRARLMAAGGALPLPPPQIAAVLWALTLDPEAEVAEKATASLVNLPDHVVDAALAADVHPGLLDWFVEHSRDDEARLEKVALNANTTDATYCLLATLPSRRIVDIVAGNQVRLLRCPELVDALGDNPVTGQATVDRILHFLGVERGEAEGEIDDPMAEEVPDAPDPSDAYEDAGESMDIDDVSDLPPDLMKEEDPPEGESDEEKDARSQSLYELIGDMNVMEKVKLARLGNGEARALLIRDRNKLVASAVIRSPKVTENEVTMFAKSRNVCDDVLRIISNNREWTRGYQVKLALVSNPKAPLQSAIKFLNYLTDRDLQMAMRSRDVRGPIKQQARRILIRKGKA